MRYSFKEFEFDSKSLVLTKAGDSVPIRHNEAKVLALLLQQADKVLSKEEILSLVWQDKVVSEQAIFQNISHLRSLFGNDAIKTFPKRGYQWALALNLLPEENNLLANVESAEVETVKIAATTDAKQSESPAKTQSTWLYIATVCMVLFFILFFYFGNSPLIEKSNHPKKIAYIPISTIQGDDEASLEDSFTLIDNEHFDFTALTDLTTEQFHNTSELKYRTLAPSHPLILTAHVRRHNHQIYLDLRIKGPFADWQGQLSAASTDEVMQKLQSHLQQDVIYNLLNTAKTPELKQANLSISHQKSPNDLIVLGALIKIYIEMNELEKAMVMADKLANIAEEQGNWQQLGNALLLQSEVLTRKDLYDLSSQKLTTAISYFEQIGDLKRQADAWYAHSWLDHQADDYPAIKKSLLHSSRLSLAAKDIPRELEALTYLSILAYKHNQEDDKYLYLQKAENKMKEYQLPIYHFAKVPFHYAFFAKTTSDKEPHWKQVLEYTKLTPDHWVAQTSRKALMRHFIKKDRLTEAKALLDYAHTDNAQNSYLKALMAQASKDNERFNHHAQRTFEQARLAGETRLSLDVALLLCSEPSEQVNYDFYSQYINDNADNNWRRNNKEKLLALNF